MYVLQDAEHSSRLSCSAGENAAHMTNNREYDVVLFGATGYTGRLVAEELLRRASGARLALAGRNAAKLDQLRRALGQASLPLLVGDSNDASFLTQLARSTASPWSPPARKPARATAMSRAKCLGCAA